MESIISKLEKIIINYRKSGSRGYLPSTLKLKLEEIELIKKEFSDLINKKLIKPEEIQKNKNTFEKYYHTAKTLLEGALKTQEKITYQQSLINMANQQFNLEIALKVIPEFTGNYKELNSFLTIIELINDGLAIDQKAILLNFVYNVKLTSTVRTSLGVSTPSTFSELKNILSNRYKTTKTVAQIQATLSTFSQKSMKIHTYHEKLLDLIAELNELQIKEIQNCSTTQAETIKLLNETYALNIFKNGLNGELKPTIFASRPKELNDAVQLALELEKEFSNNNDQILYFSNNKYNKKRMENYRSNKYHSNNNRMINYNTNSNNNNYRANNNNNRTNNNNNRPINRNNYNNNYGNRTANYKRTNSNRNRNNNQNIHCVQGNFQSPEVSQENAQTHYPE